MTVPLLLHLHMQQISPSRAASLLCQHQVQIMGVTSRPGRSPAHGPLQRLERTSDRLLLRAFAAGLLAAFVVLTAALDDALMFMSESLWLTHGGRMATEGATEGGAGSMSMGGVSVAGAGAWRASWTEEGAIWGLDCSTCDALAPPSGTPDRGPSLLRQAPISQAAVAMKHRFDAKRTTTRVSDAQQRCIRIAASKSEEERMISASCDNGAWHTVMAVLL